jgi:hypothetical protein
MITIVSSLHAKALTKLYLWLDGPPSHKWGHLHSALNQPRFGSLSELFIYASLGYGRYGHKIRDRDLRREMHFELMYGLHGFRLESVTYFDDDNYMK